MEKEGNVIKFSDGLTELVSSLNLKLLKEGKLATDPTFLMFHSYDCINIETMEVPKASMCRFTISGLQSILPLFNIEMDKDERIKVEGEYVGEYKAYPTKNHIEYIKEIAMRVIMKYDGDEAKLPKNLYKWYYEDKEKFSKE